MSQSQTHTLSVPGASISYTLTTTPAASTAPLLLLVSGANGEATIWANMAAPLSAHYRVCSYARRGFSDSKYASADPDVSPNTRLAEDAADAAALITHLSPGSPAYMVGSSSGAIVSLALVQTHPELVRLLIAHEPPLTKVLGEPGAQVWGGYNAVYEKYRDEGIVPAITMFSTALAGEGNIERDIAMVMAAKENEPNAHFFFNNELTKYTAAEVDIEKLKAAKDRFVLGAGSGTEIPFFGEVATVLAEKAGTRVELFPGGHLGFASEPAGFAKRVEEVLGSK